MANSNYTLFLTMLFAYTMIHGMDSSVTTCSTHKIQNLNNKNDRSERWYSLGCQYISGNDFELAKICLSQAFNLGHLDASHNLGVICEYELNYKKACMYYSYAAHRGHPKSQCNLGAKYLHGLGVVQNPGLATKYFRHAAAQGDDYAAYNLGWLYHQGFGVPQDTKMAAQYLLLSASKGNKIAQEYLTLYIPAEYHTLN